MASASEKLRNLPEVPLPIDDDALFYLVQDLGTVATNYSVTFADLASQAGGSSSITALTGDVTATGPGSVPATLSNTGVSAATYGSATQVAQIAVNAKGRITSAANVSITATGSVTSVASGFTGGLISVAGSPITTSGTLAFTVAGTSGGIPYFSSSSTWASSAALTAHGVMIGGGAGTAPTSTGAGTTGQILTSNGASADPTFQTFSGAVTGSGTAGRIAYWSSSSALTTASGILIAQSATSFIACSDAGSVGDGFPIEINLSSTSTVPAFSVSNRATATQSLASIYARANNNNTIAFFLADGLGTTSLGTAGLLIGMFDNQPVGFYTNNTERMRIAAAGGVSVASLTASRPVLTDGSKILVSGSAGFSGTVSPVTSITVVNGIVTACS